MPPIVVPPPFVPHFREAYVIELFTGTKSLLNSNYFADHATAEWIAKKYGDGNVYEFPFSGAGGTFYATANEYHTKIGDRYVNTGILAAYYERNPEDKFPGLAEKLIRSALANG